MSDKGKRTPALDTSKLLTDEEILRQAHRFVRTDDDDDATEKKKEDPASASWVKPAAVLYESALFKEFAIVDLSRASEAILASAASAEARAKRKGDDDGDDDGDGDESDKSDDDDETTTTKAPPIGLRWRTEAEVVSGKGETTCAERSCSTSNGKLETLELPFAYREAGKAKAALVKCRLCSRHARVARWAASAAKRERERARDASCSDSSSSDDEEEKKRRKKRKKKEKKKDKKKKKKSKH